MERAHDEAHAERGGRAVHPKLLCVTPPLVKCPTCGRQIEWSEQNAFRPFCSERCRLIDLGAWLSEQRAIPGESVPTSDEQTRPDDER
jgi:endogenous inhibitor of DNA gyrase (YacG/DUF329 family)